MASPLTGGTLTAQRANKRWKTYHLAISHPNTVFTARINQTFPTLDGVNQIIYDGGTGTFGNVKPGMTCLIGSSAGARDIGIVRVRKALTSTIAYIGKTSGVAFADNQHLTFVDDFQIWCKEPQVTNETTLIDGDVAFGATSSFAPIVRIGPPVFILELTGATVARVWTAPTIYSPIGATAVSYLWTAPGASSTSGLTTATPTTTYNAAGEYYVSCTVTDSAGASTTVYRKVIVNPSGIEISPPEIGGDVDSGWSCRVEGYDGVDITELRDRSLCVLWKKDYVGTARDTSYGPYAGATNIRLIGWVDGESLTINPEFGTASFTIHGPAFWLDRIAGAPMNISDAADSATNWNECADLNTDKALYRLVHWQSTLSSITDVTFTGNTTPIQFANVNSGSLRQQIDGLAGEKLLARMLVDNFGCVKVRIPQSLLDSTGKAALTVLWDCASSDWIELVNFPRETVAQSSQVELGGSSWDGVTEMQIYSRAPGNISNRYGSPQAPYSTLAVDDQDEMNRLAGDVLALQNSEYPTVDIILYWPNDFIDFADYVVRLSVAAGDTPRGITWTNKRLVVEAISYEFDPDTGAESTLITLAEETTGRAGVYYFPPQPSGVDEWPVPGFGAISFPPFVPFASTWNPDVIPPPVITDGCGDDAPQNNFGLSFDRSDVDDSDTDRSSFAYLPCKLRPSSATNDTRIEIEIEYLGDALGEVNVYAIDSSKGRLLTGTVTPPGEGGNWFETTRVTFAPVGELDVAGFEIELVDGSSPVSYIALDVVSSGSASPTDGSGVSVPVVDGQTYAIEATGGPYTTEVPATTYTIFRLGIDSSSPSGFIGNSSNSGFYQDLPDDAAFVERIATLYGRVFFLAVNSAINFFAHPDDPPPVSGTGTLGYVLRNATTKGSRRILIGGGRIFNVCQVD